MKTVKVLGTGCPKCSKLAEMVEQLAREHDLDVLVQKVTDMNEIISHDILMAPALMVDGIVKLSGRLPSRHELLEILNT